MFKPHIQSDVAYQFLYQLKKLFTILTIAGLLYKLVISSYFVEIWFKGGIKGAIISNVLEDRLLLIIT